MMKLAALLSLVLRIASKKDNATAPSAGNRGMDYFLFVRQWDPSVCDTMHCYIRPQREDFTIHGLWPQYSSGGWPEYCDDSQRFDAKAVEDLLPSMREDWPSFAQGGFGFWAHEWQRHGTCAFPYVKSQHEYFSRILALHKKMDVLAALKTSGITVSESQEYNMSDLAKAIRRAFNASPMFHCNPSKAELTEVVQCISKDFEVIDCPTSLSVPATNGCGMKTRLPPLS
eukprot:jgi/Botrbrau1/13719/Bobra.250_2s0014.1